ncbi:hypothetical protein V8C44DRAFT_313983 [Trichoderma aethiopicum]
MLLTVNKFLNDAEAEPLVFPSHMAEEGHSQAIAHFGARFYRDSPDAFENYLAIQKSLEHPTSAQANDVRGQAAASPFPNGLLDDPVMATLRTPELQYALFLMNPTSVHCRIARNFISIDDDNQIEPGPRTTTVKAVTPTSGIVEGTLWPTTWIVRLPETKDCVEVFLVNFPSLRPADRGSFVTDERTGRLFGHIIHYYAPSQMALVMPAKLVAEHARRVLDQQAIHDMCPTPPHSSAPIPMRMKLKRVPGLGIVRLLSRFRGLGPLGSIAAVTIPKLPENLPNGEVRLRYDTKLGDGPPSIPITRPLGGIMACHRPMVPPGGRPMGIEFLDETGDLLLFRLNERRRPEAPSWSRRVGAWLSTHPVATFSLIGMYLEIVRILLLLYGGESTAIVCLRRLVLEATWLCLHISIYALGSAIADHPFFSAFPFV